ncbi:MAG: anaerobic ribonucleoside-triphosphate reductase [Bacillota bacterium]
MGKSKKERFPVEVYSRVVGYLSPVSVWNAGKKEEFADRKMFKVPKKEELK